MDLSFNKRDLKKKFKWSKWVWKIYLADKLCGEISEHGKQVEEQEARDPSEVFICGEKKSRNLWVLVVFSPLSLIRIHSEALTYNSLVGEGSTF